VALTVLVAAFAWAFLVKPTYRSEATISVTSESGQSDLPSTSAGLSGLAALAGLPVGLHSHKEEVIATLKARSTAEGFIRQENLFGALLDAYWDPQTQTWKPRTGSRRILVTDAVERWRKGVLHVDVDRDTGLVTVAIDWFAPQTAAEWNRLYLRFTDSLMRESAQREAEGSVAYLELQLGRTQEVEVRRSIAQILEGQLKTATLARVRDWYSLKVIDPPNVPSFRFKPNRTLVVALGVILAVIVTMLSATASLLLSATPAVE